MDAVNPLIEQKKAKKPHLRHFCVSCDTHPPRFYPFSPCQKPYNWRDGSIDDILTRLLAAIWVFPKRDSDDLRTFKPSF